MKPGLRSAPWTDDDEKIWTHLIQRSRVRSPDGLCNLCFRSEESDRHDAHLMLELARWRHPLTARCIDRMTEWSQKCLTESLPG
jgi:hypothetical protein